jgi:hypothetical protein
MIFLSQRWNKQPAGPYEIDWNNPITRGLAAFYDLRRIRITRNLATGKSSGYTAVGNGAEFVPTGIRTRGSTSDYITLTAVMTPSSPPWSVVDARRTLSGSVPWCILANVSTWYGVYGSGSSAAQTPQNNDFSGLSNPILVRNAGSLNQISTAHAYRGLNDFRGSAGGALFTDTSCSLVTNPGSFRPLSFGVSNMDIVANATVANIAYWGCFNRALTDFELKEWALRPWQAVRPERRRFYSMVPAGGVVYSLTANSANFSFAGVNATLKYNRLLTAQAANFSFAGANTTIKAARLLTAQAANFSFAGAGAALKYNRSLTAQAASAFSFAGSDATIKVTRLLTAQAAPAFSFVSTPAMLTYSGIAEVDTGDVYRGFIKNTGRLMR